MTYELTPADLADLRVWAKRCGTLRSDISPQSVSVPFIVVSPSTREFCLHSQGACVAISPKADVICWLLVQERLRPGYTREILRPDLAVDVALSPEKAAKAKREEAAFYARLRAEEAKADEDRARRRRQLNPKPAAELDLDDLL